MTEKNEMFGLLMVFTGAILWSTLSLFVKIIEMDAYLFTALRYTIALSVCCLLFFEAEFPGIGIWFSSFSLMWLLA